MKTSQKGIETIFISFIIILFLLFTTVAIKNSPYMFCKFIFWLGGCEDTYGKVCYE